MKPLKSLWWVLTLPCEEASRIVSDERDRALSRLEKVALRAHLVSCGRCKRFKTQLKVLHDAADAAQDMPDEARNRIRATIERES